MFPDGEAFTRARKGWQGVELLEGKRKSSLNWLLWRTQEKKIGTRNPLYPIFGAGTPFPWVVVIKSFPREVASVGSLKSSINVLKPPKGE